MLVRRWVRRPPVQDSAMAMVFLASLSFRATRCSRSIIVLWQSSRGMPRQFLKKLKGYPAPRTQSPSKCFNWDAGRLDDWETLRFSREFHLDNRRYFAYIRAQILAKQ